MITDEGQTEWLDLIYYSVANISVASTVTIEYLVMNKPVINILYTNDDNRHPEFVRLFNSPFYGTLHNRKDVIGCYTVTDVIDVLKDVHSLSGKNESLDDIIISNGQSLERFVNQVKEA
jgi:CDP-glycerol glycerophosphotransferase (TagB/SpsB family)